MSSPYEQLPPCLHVAKLLIREYHADRPSSADLVIPPRQLRQAYLGYGKNGGRVEMLTVGIPLGVIIGVITGLSLGLLIVYSVKQVKRAQPDSKKLFAWGVGEILGIPAFMFGGPWLTTGLMNTVDTSALLPPYMLALSVTFVGTAGYPLFESIKWLGKEIGGLTEVSNV